MSIHDGLVPLRFLTMLGHLLAMLLFYFSRVSSVPAPPRYSCHRRQGGTERLRLVVAQHDNIVVTLRYDYTVQEYDDADGSCASHQHIPRMRRSQPHVPAYRCIAVFWLMITFVAVISIGFFLGFSTFNATLSFVRKRRRTRDDQHRSCATAADSAG